MLLWGARASDDFALAGASRHSVGMSAWLLSRLPNQASLGAHVDIPGTLLICNPNLIREPHHPIVRMDDRFRLRGRYSIGGPRGCFVMDPITRGL
jgi:hypothetical protein